LMVAPAQHVRVSATALARHLPKAKPVVICAKGLEQATGKLLGEVLAEALPDATQAVLSGPSFAADVARGLPAALTLATTNETLGEALATALGYRHLRIYWSSDSIGVQLGGAVKNVLAIAAGIVEGKGLGASAHAALVTRGFAELRRLGEALGARPETLMGLSGLGDLLLTCGSPQSRNMSLGSALGQGQTLQAVLGSRRSVAEGVFTAAAVVKVAGEKGIDMPICRAVHGIVEGKITVDAAIEALLSRPQRAEG
jgi:glycerol-3-phosphate dehydrogenase (NAD(P)+)